VQSTLDAGANAVVHIWHSALGPVLAEVLLLVAVVAQLFCGTASTTAASRMLFAFSRDGAVPGSRIWRRVAPNRVPVNAVTAIAVSAWALMIPTLANGAIGYLVGTSIAVIGLYISFALPIILRIRAGSRFEHGAGSLGKHYRWISPLAVAWIAVVCVLFLMPVSPKGIPGAAEFDWNVVNYAPLTVGAAVIPVRRLVPAVGADLVHRAGPGRQHRRRAALVGRPLPEVPGVEPNGSRRGRPACGQWTRSVNVMEATPIHARTRPARAADP
jgi:amino acid transporter